MTVHDRKTATANSNIRTGKENSKDKAAKDNYSDSMAG
jgi:hypothetical protein